MQYDANGNLTNDTYTSYGARTFDGENRMLTAWDSSGQQSVYTYDGDGRRVRRKVGVQAEVWQVYGIDGELLAEYSANAAASTPQKEYGYRNGELLVTAQASANVQWMVADHLGTPRMIADRTGSLSGIKRHDYLPFGEELYAGTGNRTVAQGYTAADGVRQKFTGKERDSETGLDYFNARYLASAQGRFISPDSFGGVAFNPQSLNLYAYVQNNPLTLVDPTGHFSLPSKGGGVGVFPLKNYLVDELDDRQGLCGTGCGQEPVPPFEPIVEPGEGDNYDYKTVIQADPRAWGQCETCDADGNSTERPQEEISTRVARDNDDFRRVNLSFSPKFLFGAGVSFSYTWDKYGGRYLSVGPTVGLGLPVSASLQTGQTFLNGEHVRSRAGVQGILTGPSNGINVCALFCMGGSWNANPLLMIPSGTGGTITSGGGVPEASFTKDWTWKLPF